MREEDIRKRNTFNEYLKLVEEDVKRLFNFDSFIEIDCPACGGAESNFELEKADFKYVSCKKCHTLFANPRPPFEALRRFYSDSASTTFWVERFFNPVAEKRREKIFKPRAEYINGILDKDKAGLIGDIGGGFGIFLEELRKILPNKKYVAIEPSEYMANICREKKLLVENGCLEDMSAKNKKGDFELLTAFELAEHVCDPPGFFRRIHSLLSPNGYLYVTTLNGRGFDISLLWEESKSIAPPQHLNFFNPKSIRLLLERLGFEVLEVSTPGRLDWDIVEGMIKNEGVDRGKLWDSIAEYGDEKVKRELQDWISRNNLSSHMRVVAKKPLAEK